LTGSLLPAREGLDWAVRRRLLTRLANEHSRRPEDTRTLAFPPVCHSGSRCRSTTGSFATVGRKMAVQKYRSTVHITMHFRFPVFLFRFLLQSIMIVGAGRCNGVGRRTEKHKHEHPASPRSRPPPLLARTARGA